MNGPTRVAPAPAPTPGGGQKTAAAPDLFSDLLASQLSADPAPVTGDTTGPQPASPQPATGRLRPSAPQPGPQPTTCGSNKATGSTDARTDDDPHCDQDTDSAPGTGDTAAGLTVAAIAGLPVPGVVAAPAPAPTDPGPVAGHQPVTAAGPTLAPTASGTAAAVPPVEPAIPGSRLAAEAPAAGRPAALSADPTAQPASPAAPSGPAPAGASLRFEAADPDTATAAVSLSMTAARAAASGPSTLMAPTSPALARVGAAHLDVAATITVVGADGPSAVSAPADGPDAASHQARPGPATSWPFAVGAAAANDPAPTTVTALYPPAHDPGRGIDRGTDTAGQNQASNLAAVPPAPAAPSAAAPQATAPAGATIAVPTPVPVPDTALHMAGNTPAPGADVRLVLRLDPPSLGELTITMRRDTDGLHVHVLSQAPLTAGQTQQLATAATSAATAAGTNLAGFDTSSSHGGGQHQPGHQPPPGSYRPPTPAVTRAGSGAEPARSPATDPGPSTVLWL